ncbi:hypothetical protein [uncultured Aeromicrobium sp.]|uniref:hypothetical protein n=1 Tax=uncultured Aeromicrobium sp. TaxID=337820 RepID=UPI0025F67840|nr:hypothetical protein [uncultured Aeromicrobium sp.]
MGWLFVLEGGSSTDEPEHAGSGVGVGVDGSSTGEWVLREYRCARPSGASQETSGGTSVVVFSTRDLSIASGGGDRRRVR